MKAGLLPLYVTLYDNITKEYRKRLEPFYEEIASRLSALGAEIVKSPFCMEEDDFEKAVKLFEGEKCDAIITLHMAYSPSLKCIDALKKTDLPIIICDTTDTFDFSDNGNADDIMYCHGVHGVMDMCNLLKKNGKNYVVAAGHYEKSDVIKRTVGYLKAAASANALYGAKVGTIGGYFDGMGDFRIDDKVLDKMYGAKVITPKKNELENLAKTVTDAEIDEEIRENAEIINFIEDINDDVYRNSCVADITLKKWIENNKLDSFTINFREVASLPTMPFNAVCKSMAKGIGYAGEGDKLTALYTGALMKEYKDTSFVEIFCPDWQGNAVFISHMGEMNYNLCGRKPEGFEKEFIFGDGANPIVATGCYKDGDAVFVNIFEDENGLNLLSFPVEVKNEKTDNFIKNIRGWLKFETPLDEVLEKISNCGGTHHSILVYGTNNEEMAFFAKCAKLNAIK